MTYILVAKKGYQKALFRFKKMADLTAFVEVALNAYMISGDPDERDLIFEIKADEAGTPAEKEA